MKFFGFVNNALTAFAVSFSSVISVVIIRISVLLINIRGLFTVQPMEATRV